MSPSDAEAFLALDSPWPTTDVLAKLVEAAEHLLRVHGCDAHGWEEVSTAAGLGRQRLQALGLEVPGRLGRG